MFVPPLKV